MSRRGHHLPKPSTRNLIKDYKSLEKLLPALHALEYLHEATTSRDEVALEPAVPKYNLNISKVKNTTFANSFLQFEVV